ncbi:MAG: imidazole glycerol phosphate synthase subunit HisH [Chloroflexi bacterium]|nr:imidazole glycerol phosphate synthase subunit HisH [Chloroflexota bacterium]
MRPVRIVIVDYGAGNLRSVVKALEYLGQEPRVVNSPGDIVSADALVFPGQGACHSAMASLRAGGLDVAIREFIAKERPFFGVCLGLQLLLDWSEEGDVAGLGVLPGRVRRLPGGLKVPHMGWNQVHFSREHPVFRGIPDGSHFYFVHSYYADPDEPGVVAGTTEYGVRFCSVLARGHVVATQFHPEKSGATGLKMYENFLRLASGEGA